MMPDKRECTARVTRGATQLGPAGCSCFPSCKQNDGARRGSYVWMIGLCAETDLRISSALMVCKINPKSEAAEMRSR